MLASIGWRMGGGGAHDAVGGCCRLHHRLTVPMRAPPPASAGWAWQRTPLAVAASLLAAAAFIVLAHGRYEEARLAAGWRGGMGRGLAAGAAPLLLGWGLELGAGWCVGGWRARRLVTAGGWVLAGCGILIAEATMDSAGYLHPMLWLLPAAVVGPTRRWPAKLCAAVLWLPLLTYASWLLLSGCAADGLNCAGLRAIGATSASFAAAGVGAERADSGAVAGHAAGLVLLYACTTLQALRRRWARRAAAADEARVGQHRCVCRPTRAAADASADKLPPEGFLCCHGAACIFFCGLAHSRALRCSSAADAEKERLVGLVAQTLPPPTLAVLQAAPTKAVVLSRQRLVAVVELWCPGWPGNSAAA